MKKKIKIIMKVILVPMIIFIVGHIGIYSYCYMTPKLEINKSQIYYLYDRKSELVAGSNDNWIALEDISPYLIEATINTEDK